MPTPIVVPSELEPLVLANGRINPVWLKLLQEIARRINAGGL